MTDALHFPTGIGASDADSISLLGHDVTELMQNVTFGELAFWLTARRRPSEEERRAFEAVLVSLADHGFTPTAIAARLTYYSAPDSLQGAIAAGLLGGGSRFLGVTEDTGEFLHEALEGVDHHDSWSCNDWDALARTILKRERDAGRRMPGLGHPVHKHGDPRTPVLIGIAKENGVYGPHLALFEAIGRCSAEVLERDLPLNGAGVAGATLADLGLPIAMLRGFALLARTAGLIGHLAEEQREPVGPMVYMTVDRNTLYRPDQTREP